MRDWVERNAPWGACTTGVAVGFLTVLPWYKAHSDLLSDRMLGRNAWWVSPPMCLLLLGMLALGGLAMKRVTRTLLAVAAIVGAAGVGIAVSERSGQFPPLERYPHGPTMATTVGYLIIAASLGFVCSAVAYVVASSARLSTRAATDTRL